MLRSHTGPLGAADELAGCHFLVGKKIILDELRRGEIQPVRSCDDDQTFEPGRKHRIDIGILGDGLRDHESSVCLLRSMTSHHDFR